MIHKINYTKFYNFTFLTGILRDIRFYLLLFFIIRLIGITNPPLDTGHNWRQTVVNMVARNFIEIDNNIFYPRIDIAGEKTGITGMEFPFLNYLIYLISLIFGFEHWYGRLINLIFSSFGLYFFYRLLKKYFTQETSFYATIILCVSIWFQFSRKIMPDTFSMSFMIAAFYFGSNYLDNENRKQNVFNLLIYSLLLCLGALTKLSSAYILPNFALFIFSKKVLFKRKLIFITSSLIAMLPVVFWYFYWVPYLVENFGFWHFFMGSDLNTAITEISQNLALTFKRFYDSAMKIVAFVVFLTGIFYAVKNNNRLILKILLISFSAFSIFILKAGFFFYHHNYYIIPFVPVMALVAAYTLIQIKNKKIVYLILIIIFLENSLTQLPANRIKDEDRYLLNLESELDKFIPKNELILINSGYNPTPMYFAHRKGWVDLNDNIEVSGFVNALKDKGLKHILILKHHFGTDTVLPDYRKITENNNYTLYSLD